MYYLQHILITILYLVYKFEILMLRFGNDVEILLVE